MRVDWWDKSRRSQYVTRWRNYPMCGIFYLPSIKEKSIDTGTREVLQLKFCWGMSVDNFGTPPKDRTQVLRFSRQATQPLDHLFQVPYWSATFWWSLFFRKNKNCAITDKTWWDNYFVFVTSINFNLFPQWELISTLFTLSADLYFLSVVLKPLPWITGGWI